MTAPIRAFLTTESGGATLLVVAILAALVWTNSPWRASYGSVWSSVISIDLAGHLVAMDLRDAVNEGLMTLFFLVVGLEAKRELDLGELRDRRRLTVPVLAGVGGMIVSVALYLALTAGRGGASGWGVAASTDTALALGTLTLIAGDRGNRLRVFLLTLLVVDDVVALLIITLVYPARLHPVALAAAAALMAILLGLRWLGLRHRDDQSAGFVLFGISVLVGVGLWLALFESGIDPVISGLVIGLLTSAYTPRRSDLEHGTELVHSFRERPTPEAAYSARAGLAAVISPNERLQYRLHPWTSRVIVPLFALANAGVRLDGEALHAALTSPVSWGIAVAFIAGKPLGILAAAWVTARGAPRAGKLPVSWRELWGTANSAGIAFTASLLIAARAFDGSSLEQAKVAILVTIVVSPLLAAVSLRPLRGASFARGIDAVSIADLAVDVDPVRDHIRGPVDAPVTVVGYVSFGCRHCVAANAVIAQLLDRFGDQLRYVVRHLPLTDVDPGAGLAAEAMEAAGAQGAFWQMHDALVRPVGPGTLATVYRVGRRAGLDLERLFADLDRHTYAGRVASDVRGADASGVSGTPALFIDGRRWEGPVELEALSDTVTARLREFAGAAPAVDGAPALAVTA
ncbi:MAG TPA: Na+/H+ antiporter NhaA [Solirubrobacteraceae bacterium]|nr:Na+/H+ antiporter NhaA [Solirubrobacteraceae bacterium]